MTIHVGWHLIVEILEIVGIALRGLVVGAALAAAIILKGFGDSMGRGFGW